MRADIDMPSTKNKLIFILLCVNDLRKWIYNWKSKTENHIKMEYFEIQKNFHLIRVCDDFGVENSIEYFVVVAVLFADNSS